MEKFNPHLASPKGEEYKKAPSPLGEGWDEDIEYYKVYKD